MQIDRILTNGQARTLDASGTVGSAVAIVGGRVAAVGSTDEMLELAGPQADRIDVGGHTVLPAFIDSHAHLRRASLAFLSEGEHWTEIFGEVRPTRDAH